MAIPLDALTSRIRSTVLLPHDSGYDQARSVWNGMSDKHPRVIVQCSGVADVIASVSYAREQSLPLAIKAGGRNVSRQGRVQ